MSGYHHVDLRHIDKAQMPVGLSAFDQLQTLVEDTLGGTFWYLDPDLTDHDGTGLITGNVRYGDTDWSVGAGSAYVDESIGFPCIRLPFGAVVNIGAAPINFGGTNATHTIYTLAKHTGGAGTTFMFGNNAQPYFWELCNNANRRFGYSANVLATGDATAPNWQVARTRYNNAISQINGASTQTDSAVFSAVGGLAGIAPTVVTSLRGAGAAGNSLYHAFVIDIPEDTVVSGNDALLRAAIRNASGLALVGGMWP